MMQKEITLAQKMKHISDAANEPKQEPFPEELYNYVLREIENSAKDGGYKCFVDLRPKPDPYTYDSNEYYKFSNKLLKDAKRVADKLIREGFTVDFVGSDNFMCPGDNFLSIQW